MNYLTAENITRTYGEHVLFQNLNFHINKDEKIAFIAKNGTGKTSLLNIITGLEPSDIGGSVRVHKDIKMAYLSQDEHFDEELTIEETLFSSEHPTLKVIENYEKALQNMDDEKAYQLAFEQMDKLQAWDFENQFKLICSKLKLNDLSLKIKTLSGGQKKRLSLVIRLINKPDLLILDEPTNHLDLEMIEWLESYFTKEKITLFMVTHDRYFLERVCNQILELDQGKLYSYKGNYSYFLAKKKERIASEQASIQKAKNLFAKELDWMRRQPKARTTKSKSRIDDFYVIKQKAKSRREEHQVTLEINMERLGSKIVEIHNLSKSFGDLKITDQFNYNFLKGERIGIIGKNGTGKSSFLNILLGQEQPDSGKIIIGDTIKFGYYNQKGIKPKAGQKVIDVIKEFGEFIPLAKGHKISAAQLLERFLFDRKKQYDFVEKLSGGEKKRLYLCTVLIQNPNFLILDEPTNDLDIVTLNVLEQFLLDFPGNLIVVSHDRYFMDKIVDSLFVFKGDGVIENFPGNYSDYRTYNHSISEEKSEKKEKKERVKTTTVSKMSYKEKREFESLEKELAVLQKEKITKEQAFVGGTILIEEMAQKSEELSRLLKLIEEKEERWFELASIEEIS